MRPIEGGRSTLPWCDLGLSHLLSHLDRHVSISVVLARIYS